MKIPFSPPLLLSVSLSLLLSLSATAATAATKPNILILFADDQRADTIGAHGNAHIKTPVIDGLVRDGTSFRRNYVMGGNSGAVCVPSRAMLMTGKTWFAMNTATLAGEKLLPELFGENGYTTFGTGKWHNGQPSWLRAFQKGERIMFGGMSDHEKVPVRDLGPDGKLTEQRIGDKFSTELFADAAIRFLEQHDPAAGANPSSAVGAGSENSFRGEWFFQRGGLRRKLIFLSDVVPNTPL
jgi:arylsulfatase A-like enzyme